MDGPGATVVPDGAIVLDGPRIAQVGDAATVLAANPDAEVVHLPGHAVLPGLVNAHTHLAMTMFRGIADDRHLADFLDTVVPLESALLDAERVRLATRAALVESHLAGVTTTLDMYFFCDAVLDAADEVGARVLTGPVVLDAGGPDAPPGSWGLRMERAREWLADHPPGPDWLPVVGPHSTYTVGRDHLVEAGALAEEHGALFHIHAAETAAEVDVVARATGHRPVELLGGLGLLGPHTVLAHAVHVDAGEVRSVAESGAAVVHCPASNLKLASGVAPARTLRRAGVRVALGTDGPASSNDLDVLGAVRLAALAHKAVAPEGPDATSLPAAEVLAMATRDGAHALGLGGRLGVLRAGAVADLVAIDLHRPHTQPVHDVCSAVVYAAGRGDVTDVWSRGRRVVRAGAHELVPERVVVEDLARLGAEVVEQG